MSGNTQPLPAVSPTAPPRPPVSKAPSRWLLIIVGCITGLILTPLIGLLIPPIYSFGVVKGFFWTWVVLSILAGAYFMVTRKIAEEHVLEPWQKSIRIVKCTGAPEELVRTIAFKLEPKELPNGTVVYEDIIEEATRKHPIKLWRHLTFPVGLLLVRFVELGLLAPMLESWGVPPGVYWRIYIITMLANILWIVLVVQEWRHELLVITNYYVREIKYRPAYLWFLLPKDDQLPMSKILDFKDRQSRLGVMMNYGTISLGTAMTDAEDKPYRDIRFIPNHQGIKRAITKRML